MSALKLKKEYIEEQKEKTKEDDNISLSKDRTKVDYFSEKFIIPISIILIIGVINGYISTPSYLKEQNLGRYISRILGGMLGFSIIIILLSSIVALIAYLLFHKVAQKYKRYGDYLAIVLIFGIFLAISLLLTAINLKD